MASSSEKQSSEPNTPATPAPEVYNWSVDELGDYVGPRVSIMTGIASAGGASIGYYTGVGPFTPMYTYGLSAVVIGTTFFATHYALRNLRQKDDTVNYGAAGLLNGAMIGAIQSRRHSIVGSAIGAICGVTYNIMRQSVYATTREMHISHRRHILENSKPAVLTFRRPPVDPRNVRLGDVPTDRRVEASASAPLPPSETKK
jgi:hypothetical protein